MRHVSRCMLRWNKATYSLENATKWINRKRQAGFSLTLLRWGDRDGLSRELLVKIPGVCLRCDLGHEGGDELEREKDRGREGSHL